MNPLGKISRFSEFNSFADLLPLQCVNRVLESKLAGVDSVVFFRLNAIRQGGNSTRSGEVVVTDQPGVFPSSRLIALHKVAVGADVDGLRIDWICIPRAWNSATTAGS